jgi:VWFA-related protein
MTLMTVVRTALAVLLLPIFAAAQQPPQVAPPVVENVQVNVVNVEVFVTDRDGRPFPGLTAADFVLSEDGRPVELTNFYIGDGFAAAPVPTPGDAGITPVPTQPPPHAVDETQALHVVVLVDGLNTTNTSRNIAIDAVAKVLETRLHQGDDVMVVSFNRMRRIHCPLTMDVKGATRVLRSVKGESSEGSFRRADRLHLLDMVEWSGPSGHEDSAMIGESRVFEATAAAERLWGLERQLFRNAGQLIDSLAGLPGRKALVFVSEGIPSQVGRAMFRELEARYPGQAPSELDRTQYNLNDNFMNLGRRANAGRVTFYTVDAQLYRGLASADAEQLSMAEDPGGAVAEDIDKDLSMVGLAKATGGQVMFNTTSLEEKLGEVMDNLDAFYSLGFSPSHSGDGRYHKLAVKVKREGVRLRYREGYLDKPEAMRLADRTAAALLRRGQTNQLGVEVETGAAVAAKGKALKIPLTVSLPGSSITLLPTRDGMAGKVVVAVAGTDFDGRNSEVHREAFTVPVPREKVAEMRKQKVVFTFDVLVREGFHTLAVTARDEAGQVESTVTVDIEVHHKS